MEEIKNIDCADLYYVTSNHKKTTAYKIINYELVKDLTVQWYSRKLYTHRITYRKKKNIIKANIDSYHESMPNIKSYDQIMLSHTKKVKYLQDKALSAVKSIVESKCVIDNVNVKADTGDEEFLEKIYSMLAPK